MANSDPHFGTTSAARAAEAARGAWANGGPLSLSVNRQILLLALDLLLWTWVGVSSRSNFDHAGDLVEAGAKVVHGSFKRLRVDL